MMYVNFGNWYNGFFYEICYIEFFAIPEHPIYRICLLRRVVTI